MVREATCRATKRDGSRCGSRVLLPSGYCPMHDPAKRDAMAAARAKGGRQRATVARLDRLVPSTLRPVLAQLLDALDGVKAGTLAPRQGQALAALASAIVKVYSAGGLEERVATLEAEAQREAEARTV